MNNKGFLYIVAADDDPDDHELIKLAVKDCDQNHIVTSVFNGQQLLDLLNHKGFHRTQAQTEPDVVILDLMMPIIDGLEALKQIKQSDKLKSIPVYVLTASKFEPSLKKAMDLGAAGFFSKPVKYEDLRKLIGRICRNHMSAS